jgi:hypothetical protein
VRRFGEDTDRTADIADHQLERNQQRIGDDGQQCGAHLAPP